MPERKFPPLHIGDEVVRNFAGKNQGWRVTKVEGDLVTVGMGWTFDLITGWEVDEDLQWGPKYGRTGSYLVSVRCIH